MVQWAGEVANPMESITRPLLIWLLMSMLKQWSSTSAPFYQVQGARLTHGRLLAWRCKQIARQPQDMHLQTSPKVSKPSLYIWVKAARLKVQWGCKARSTFWEVHLKTSLHVACNEYLIALGALQLVDFVLKVPFNQGPHVVLSIERLNNPLLNDLDVAGNLKVLA